MQLQIQIFKTEKAKCALIDLGRLISYIISLADTSAIVFLTSFIVYQLTYF